MLPRSSDTNAEQARLHGGDSTTPDGLGSSNFEDVAGDCKLSKVNVSDTADKRWPAELESEIARQRPFSYVDQGQFNQNHNRYLTSEASSVQHGTLLLSDPYLSSHRSAGTSDVADGCGRVDASPIVEPTTNGGLYRSAAHLSAGSAGGGPEDEKPPAGLLNTIDHRNQGSEIHGNYVGSGENASPSINGTDDQGHNRTWSDEERPWKSSCFTGGAARVPCASIWCGIFIVAEVIAFCVIAAGFASSTVSKIQQRFPSNGTPDTQEIRAIYSAVLSLVALVQILAVIAHVLVAAAVGKRQSFEERRILSCCHRFADCSSVLKSTGGRFAPQPLGKRQLIKQICFKLIQLLVIFTFFVLFLFWLIMSLTLSAVLSMSWTTPQIFLPCESGPFPDAQVGDPESRPYLFIAQSGAQNGFMKRCTESLGEDVCSQLLSLCCDLAPEWLATLPILLGCSLLLVISILLALCCQSLNYGRDSSSVGPIYQILGFARWSGKKGHDGSTHSQTRSKPFDRVLAELWQKDHRGDKVAVSKTDPGAANGVLL